MFKGTPVQLICLTFPYVPGRLSLTLSCNFDKLLCAAVECFGINKEDCFPPIKVIEGKEDIVVKMSDEGGGIPRSAVPLICT